MKKIDWNEKKNANSMIKWNYLCFLVSFFYYVEGIEFGDKTTTGTWNCGKKLRFGSKRRKKLRRKNCETKFENRNSVADRFGKDRGLDGRWGNQSISIPTKVCFEKEKIFVEKKKKFCSEKKKIRDSSKIYAWLFVSFLETFLTFVLTFFLADQCQQWQTGLGRIGKLQYFRHIFSPYFLFKFHWTVFIRIFIDTWSDKKKTFRLTEWEKDLLFDWMNGWEKDWVSDWASEKKTECLTEFDRSNFHFWHIKYVQ